jgi:hypothetical protein
MRELKDRLRVLDAAQAPDLWPDAQHRTPRAQPEPPTPTPPTSSRIAAGVVAFAVCFAAFVFVWQAFRPGPVSVQGPGSVQAASDGVAGVALWPERTAADLAQTQALADSGDPSVTWRLDPKEGAIHFIEDVLGWGKPVDDSRGVHYAVAVDPSWSPGDSIAIISVSQLAVPCPSPLPGESMACPLPYEGETLTLKQLGATGPAGVWSVTEVRASGFDLALTAGDHLHNGDSLSGNVSFPPTADAVPDFVVQSGFTVGTDPDCTSGSIDGGTQEGGISIDVSVPSGGWAAGGCDATSPGFAFIATAGVPPCPDDVVGCPVVVLVSPSLSEGVQPLFGLTAVPMLMSVLEDSSTGSPSKGG